jgi:predicted secreted protein
MSAEIHGAGTARASVGEHVVVRLDEVGTTGYQWQPAAVPDGLELVSSEFQPPTSAAPGAGGQRIITLRATKSGEHHLTVERRRAWEPAAAETAEVVVTVSA